ncbi:hypothetical protein NDU88_011409 [Pleurodeles waltl]|uniref:Uncharacterized protein n=1 Tax=Pleurodeles waltl TaxID=8319 RepID=A0AAV7PYC6_PLEWA|nr:hypothetical protein NDU88_011409 [Pleurodeles waltl]
MHLEPLTFVKDLPRNKRPHGRLLSGSGGSRAFTGKQNRGNEGESVGCALHEVALPNARDDNLSTPSLGEALMTHIDDVSAASCRVAHADDMSTASLGVALRMAHADDVSTASRGVALCMVCDVDFSASAWGQDLSAILADNMGVC